MERPVDPSSRSAQLCDQLQIELAWNLIIKMQSSRAVLVAFIESHEKILAALMAHEQSTEGGVYFEAERAKAWIKLSSCSIIEAEKAVIEDTADLEGIADSIIGNFISTVVARGRIDLLVTTL